MLVISVAVLAIVLGSYGFVPEFRAGVNKVGSDVEQMLSTGQRTRRAPPTTGSPSVFPPNYRLPNGPRNAGCASGTACNPLPPAGTLGSPMNVCRRGDNC